MSALDIFVIVLLGGGAFLGLVRGLVHEVLSLMAWVVAIVMLRLFHSPISVALTEPVGTSFADHAGTGSNPAMNPTMPAANMRAANAVRELCVVTAIW